jgi:polysulfide reductase chain C
MSSRLYGLVQTQWRWLIAFYLFLAGMGAGAHLTGVVAEHLGWPRLAAIGIGLGWPLVLIGCLCLLGDLGNVRNAWRVARKPDTSWIARGTLIISIFMIVAFIHMVVWIWPGPLAGTESTARQVIGVIGAVFAFATMVYTGLLLGDALPFPFWSTVLLPILFFVSALSTGIMAIILIGTSTRAPAAQLTALARVDVVLLVAEALVLAVYLHGSYRLPSTRMSAQYVLNGDVAGVFWFGVVACGLGIPLVVDILARSDIAVMIACVLGLMGGLFLRYVVLAGGAMYPIAAAGFTFRPTTRPKDPLPAMGKLPPG